MPDSPVLDEAPRLPPADRVSLPTPPRPQPVPRAALGIPAASGLVRRRVMRQLDRLREVRICVVVAPAGYGKTTALASWANRAPVDVAWLRAPHGAGDPVTAVLSGMRDAMDAVVPGRRVAPTPAAVADRLRGHEGPLVVVIDDFHHVAVTSVGEVLEEILLSTDVHLVLASRTTPTLNLARTELPSLQYGAADLRFRAPETEQLFRTVHEAPLTEADARLLTRHVGGWAAGLHLFHHATAPGGPTARRRVLRDQEAVAWCAEEYIEREVLAALEPADLDLLRRTSLLESLTARRCERLLGSRVSEWQLHDLARRGVVDQQGGEYQLGTLVRSRLAMSLRDELGDTEMARLSRTCADLLEADERPAAAARTHAARGDWVAAAEVLARHPDQVLADPDLDWVADAPESTRLPWLRLARATLLYRDGRLPAALAAAGDPVVDADPELSARLAALVRSGRLWWAGDVQPGRCWFEQIRSAFRRPDPSRAGTAAHPNHGESIHRAVELAVAGRLTAARHLLDETLPDDGVVTLMAWMLRAALGLEEATAADLAELAEQYGVPWFARIADAVTAPACSPSRVAEADAMGDRWGALFMVGLGAVQQLRAGDPAPAEFDDLAARCRALDAPALEAWARAGLALAAIAAQLPEATREAESAVGFAHSAQVPGASVVARAALGLARGDADLVARAAEEADVLGLGCRPWEAVLPSRTERARIERRSAPPVEVRCFGGFEIRVAGEAPELNRIRPRAREVLRMLALHAGRPVHREMLVDAMWPQLDAAAATHNLHVAVSSLRSVLEPGVPRGASRLLPRDGDRYALALPDGSVSDVAAFDAALHDADNARAAGDIDAAIDHLTLATDLYAGPVLPEDGPAEWVIDVREQCQVRAAEAAARLGDLHLRRDRPADAATAARRSIEIDPCRDASWRLLIVAYDTIGNLAAAERARRSYAEVLVSLGVVESRASGLRDR